MLRGGDTDAKFVVPNSVYDVYGNVASKGAAAVKEWNALLSSYAKSFPKQASELHRRVGGARAFVTSVQLCSLLHFAHATLTSNMQLHTAVTMKIIIISQSIRNFAHYHS